MSYTLLLWIFAFILGIGASSNNLETVYEWKYFKVAPVPVEERVGDYNESTYFNYRMAVPFDTDMSKDGRVFVTIVAKPDVQVSLWTVSSNLADTGPVLEPYPNYSWHSSKKDCSKIISSWSITIDACNRLWVLDSGRLNRADVCPAKLMAFDLTDNKLINSYVMPTNVYANVTNNRSALVNPVIHTDKSQCDKITVFIADSEGYGLIVFDGTTFKRLDNQKYNPDRKYFKFEIAGESFILPGGITPMDLDPEGQHLFFAPLSSRALYGQNVKDLIDGKESKVNGTEDMFDGQGTAFRLSKRNILFAGVTTSKIVCWNRHHREYSTKDTVAEDAERLQYITALKIIPAESSKSGEEELLVMSNRLQKSIKQSRNFDEINFRVMKGKVAQLIKNTKCDGAV